MRYLALAALIVAVGVFARPAYADSVKITRLINATESDYETVKTNFQEAHRDGGALWESNSSGLVDITNRITARREAIEALMSLGDRVLPVPQRGLFRLVLEDLDRTNLLLLALIKDDRGYAGYVRTGNEELVKGIADWQEGIRQAIIQTKRCAQMVKAVAGPFVMHTRLAPMRDH